MIISASRRTDIPAFYADWFLNRIREGFVLSRNPMNIHQVSSISLDPAVIDGIVFWTKNPIPLMDHLDELKDYSHYFQFTLNPYAKDVEPEVPSKAEVMIPAFQRLSEKIGPERVIWRYDPIFLNETYTPDYHAHFFGKLAEQLSPYTSKCVISFIDLYKKTERNMKGLDVETFTEDAMRAVAESIVPIAREHDLRIETCAEKIDLSHLGVEHGCCIDATLLERISGRRLSVSKDKNQRLECGCMASIDIGAYNTCAHGCKYCYANFNTKVVAENLAIHDPKSPLLCGEVGPDDKITDRKMRSLAEGDEQLSLL